MPHLAIGFFFLRRNKYEIAKVRYFPGEKLYKGILQFFPFKKGAGDMSPPQILSRKETNR